MRIVFTSNCCIPAVLIVAPGPLEAAEFVEDVDEPVAEDVDEPVVDDEPDALREAVPDVTRFPLTSTSWPTWRGIFVRSLRKAYMLVADLSGSPFLSTAPLSAADGCVLPARAADSLVPEPGGAIDVTPLPPPGAAPTLALARMNWPAPDCAPLAERELSAPDVPTGPRSPAADCRQPVKVIVDWLDWLLSVLELCAPSPAPQTTTAANTAVCSLHLLFMIPLTPPAL